MQKLDPQPWMTAPETVRLMAVLKDARFVGGVVRNALLKQPVSDIDIATPLKPAKVIALLEAAGLKAVPTGIEHGTVTAVVEGKPFEVTTLRRDVATDGRHAVVAFTTDWALDAQRRDFTMNALYADAEGVLYDTVGGVEDALAGRLRFVGDPQARIREDYLRILRFFRFHAWYGKEPPDAAALAACAAEKAGLAELSGERIAKEMLKLLEARDPVPVLQAMAEAGLLADLVAGASDRAVLSRLVAIDTAMDFAPDGVLRLATILPKDRTVLTAQLVAARWKLSNAQKERLVAAAGASRAITPFADPKLARRLLYRQGAEAFHDALCLALAAEPRDDWRAIVEALRGLTAPTLPISGKDVLARGISMGPLIGFVLREVEAWWVEADFPDDAAVFAQLDAIVKQVTE